MDILEVSTSSISLAFTSGTFSLKDVEKLQIPWGDLQKVLSFPSLTWNFHAGYEGHNGAFTKISWLERGGSRARQDPWSPKKLLDSLSSKQLLSLSLFHSNFHLPPLNLDPVYFRDSLICCSLWGKEKESWLMMTSSWHLSWGWHLFSSCYWFLIMPGYSEDQLICSVIFGGNF